MKKIVAILLSSIFLSVFTGSISALAWTNYDTYVKGMGNEYYDWGGRLNGMLFFGWDKHGLVDEAVQNGSYDYVFSSTPGAKTSFYMGIDNYPYEISLLEYVEVSIWGKRGIANESTQVSIFFRHCEWYCAYDEYWDEEYMGTVYLSNDWTEYTKYLFNVDIFWGPGYDDYYQVVLKNTTGHPQVTKVDAVYGLSQG